MLFVYNAVVGVALILLLVVSTGKSGVFRLHHPSSPALVREVVAIGVVLLVILPYAMFCVALFSGGWIALAEGWSFVIGFEYVLSNISGIALALTGETPSTGFGEFVEIMMSLWTMLFTAVLIGIVSGMGIVRRALAMLPPSLGALLLCILLFIPSALLVLSAFTGLTISAFESWPAEDGFFFMVGTLCGLANPLTAATPSTPGGKFVETLAIIGELFLASAVIGVVSAHPICRKAVAILEGKEAREGPTTLTPEKGRGERDAAPGSKLAWTSPVVPVEAATPPAQLPGELAVKDDEDEADALRSELQSLQAKHRLLEARLRDTGEATRLAEHEVGALQTKFAAAQTEVSTLREETARRAEREKALSTRVAELEQQNSELELERRRLQDELQHIRDQKAEELEDV